ncbi:MAG: hypothetical protein WD187_03220 [Candidatus Woykebacteria bacterium]
MKAADLEAYFQRVGLTPQDLVEQMRQLQADLGYFSAHYEDLQGRYPNCFVAVYENKVVGWGKDYHRLIYRLRRRGQPVHKVVIKKAYKKGEEPVWILRAAA